MVLVPLRLYFSVFPVPPTARDGKVSIERTGRVPRFHSEDAKTRAAPRSVAASQRRDTAKTRAAPPAASQRRSVTAPQRREDTKTRAAPSGVAASQRCSVAKMRGDPSDVAASQRHSAAKTRRRQDARRPQRRGSVAASRSREDARRSQRRGSVAASQRRYTAKNESSPLSGVAVITESLGGQSASAAVARNKRSGEKSRNIWHIKTHHFEISYFRFSTKRK